MGAKVEGVNFSVIVHLAGRLEEGGRVGRGPAARSQQQHARRLGQGLTGVVQKDPRVVPILRNHVQLVVMHLEDQVLDPGVLSNPANTQ